MHYRNWDPVTGLNIMTFAFWIYWSWESLVTFTYKSTGEPPHLRIHMILEPQKVPPSQTHRPGHACTPTQAFLNQAFFFKYPKGLNTLSFKKNEEIMYSPCHDSETSCKSPSSSFLTFCIGMLSSWLVFLSPSTFLQSLFRSVPAAQLRWLLNGHHHLLSRSNSSSCLIRNHRNRWMDWDQFVTGGDNGIVFNEVLSVWTQNHDNGPFLH